MAKTVQIGQVLKSNGTDGQVVIGLHDVGPEDISEKEPVFICFDGLPVPFFINDIQQRSNTRILARLTDINSLEDAEELVGKTISIEADIDGDDDGFIDFTGWTLLGEDGGLLGEITGLEDIPGNPCIEVKTRKGTVLVPLHEDLVVDIDKQGKALAMRIPDGLL